jgi:succinate dehydrogenase / fumarate reductase membrane anchor subunit
MATHNVGEQGLRSLRSPLGRVRGLGSAKSGVHHWWMQRVSSAALLPLTLWFVFSAAGLAGASYAETVAWIGRPWNAVLLLATIGIGFHHTAAGIQVVVEDYANLEWVKVVIILAVKAICALLALASALAVLRIAV